MKKTLVALAVTAFATSASALTVYENEGSKVDFDGSIRLLLEKQSSKANGAKSTDGHSNLKNNGSRFGISAKHQLGDDFYALARYETRFYGGAGNSAGWGSVLTNKAYAGFGGFGHEVTFGKQAVIGDEIGQADYSKYGVASDNIGLKDAKGERDSFDILTSSSDSAVSYKYTGVKGLTLGANYNFANERDKGEVKHTAATAAKPDVYVAQVDANGNPIPGATPYKVQSEAKAVDAKYSVKSGFGFGAVYTFDIADGHALTTSAGYTHDSYKVPAGERKKDKDGVYFGLKYATSGFEVAVDGGRGVEKQGQDKTKLNFVRVGAQVAVSDKVKAYGGYGYGTLKNGADKTTAHQFALGSIYKVNSKVQTFVEGRLIKNKDNATPKAKQTDKAIGVGLRVFW